MAVSLDLAMSAVRAGRREEGRQLLNLLIQQNPNNAKAWLWMSSVVESEEQQARCLYHVLAIDPDNQLARKGLQMLGIVVSDSRPVKIPRDSQPIRVAKPNLASRQPPAQLPPPQTTPPAASTPAERRPFLVSPENITQKMPATSSQAPTSTVKASPSILSIDVEAVLLDDIDDTKPDAPASAVPTSAPEAETDEVDAPAVSTNGQKDSFSPSRYTKTQKLVEPDWVKSMTNGQSEPVTPEPEPAKKVEKSKSPKLPLEAAKSANRDKPLKSKHPKLISLPQTATASDQSNLQVDPSGQPIPNDETDFGSSMPNRVTRPSQPIQVTPPPMQAMPPNQPLPSNQGLPSNYGSTPPPAGHAQPTMGMPHQPQYPVAPHSQMTMGMPIAPYSDQSRPPSEPMAPIHSNSTLGMVPYPYPQPSPQMGFHSNITMMMPTMSESEARARLAGTHPIPATDASAMALHGGPGYGYPSSSRAEPDYDDEEDSEEINIVAVIIFGTLSVTALGGFGMLILLLFTAPPV